MYIDALIPQNRELVRPPMFLKTRFVTRKNFICLSDNGSQVVIYFFGKCRTGKKLKKLTKIWVRDYLAKQYPLFNYLHLKERI